MHASKSEIVFFAFCNNGRKLNGDLQQLKFGQGQPLFIFTIRNFVNCK